MKKTINRFLDPIASLIEDTTVTEIMVNGPNQIWIERKGRLEATELQFSNNDALLTAIRHVSQYLKQPVGGQKHIVEGRLPDGSRFEAILPPLVEGGVHFTIRKFSKTILDLDKLQKIGAFDEKTAELLKSAVLQKKNIVVSGGTGSGKTSLLNALTGVCNPTERIVVIEDAREIKPQNRHCLRLEAKQADEYGKGEVSIRELFRATLRMRPDRIIVGEIRGGEAVDLISAMTSGHGGSMSTLHADSPREAISRLETMALMSDIELPLNALRPQIAMGVDVIVQVSRFRCGGRGIAEIATVDYDVKLQNYKLTTLICP